MAYYKTQIDSVRAGYAVDVTGKRLKFIGNYPCQAGDFVWNDGNVIFGNITNDSQPLLFGDKSGIPVLADNLRGYFDSSGNFKNYNIAYDKGNHWSIPFIVNNNHYYAHGTRQSYLDIEISNDGKVLTAQLDYISQREKKINIFKDNVCEKTINLVDYVPDEDGATDYAVEVVGFKLFPDLEWTMVLSIVIEGKTVVTDAFPGF